MRTGAVKEIKPALGKSPGKKGHVTIFAAAQTSLELLNFDWTRKNASGACDFCAEWNPIAEVLGSEPERAAERVLRTGARITNASNKNCSSRDATQTHMHLSSGAARSS